MKIPKELQALIDDGVIDEVVRPLKSGKEAAVYVVRAATTCAAPRSTRTWRSAASSSACSTRKGARCAAAARRARSARAQVRPQAKQETAWKNTEVDALYQLREAGVRVPEPYGYFDGVLVMELVTDAHGHLGAAPGRGRARGRRGTRIPSLPDAAGRAHAVRRPDPRRPVRVQRAGRRRRAGDHRSAAGR